MLQEIRNSDAFVAWHDQRRDRYYANPARSSAVHTTAVRCTHPFDLGAGNKIKVPKLCGDNLDELQAELRRRFGKAARRCSSCMP
jgi:hypothetical protein